MAEPRTVRYRGVFPVVPTTFTESGVLDLESQKRCVDFMIDAGSNGLCILANFSEQFVLEDSEREEVMQAALAHVAGRVPVIVTTTHFSTQVCAARSLRAPTPRRADMGSEVRGGHDHRNPPRDVGQRGLHHFLAL